MGRKMVILLSVLVAVVTAKEWSFDSAADSKSEDDDKSSFESFIKSFWEGRRPEGCPSSYNLCFHRKSCSLKKACPENSTCCPVGYGGHLGRYGGGCCIPKESPPSGGGPINAPRSGGSDTPTTSISVIVNIPEATSAPATPSGGSVPNPSTPVEP